MIIILNDAAREKGDYEQKILLLNAEVTATKLEAQEDAKKSEKCKMDLQYELHEIQNCFEKEKEKVAKCQEELKGQQLALNEAMDENRDLNVKIDFLNNTLDQLTDQLKTTNEGNEVLKDELNSERERFSFLDEKLREEGRKYESLLNVKAKSDKAFFDMKKKRADMEKKLQVTRKEFQNLQEDASKQLKRWQEVQNQREKSRMDDAIIVDEKEKYTEEIILMKQDMSLELKRTRKHATKADVAMREKADELDQAQLKLEAMEKKNIRTKDCMKDYITKLTRKCEEWADNYKSVSADFKCVKKERDESRKQNIHYITMIDELKTEFKNYENVGTFRSYSCHILGKFKHLHLFSSRPVL